MQAEHQDGGRAAGQIEVDVFTAEQFDHFVVHMFGELLARRHAVDHIGPHRLLAHTADEILYHLKMDVRFQQRHADIAQRVLNIFLRKFSVPAEIFEGFLKGLTEFGKHRSEEGFRVRGSRQTLKVDGSRLKVRC